MTTPGNVKGPPPQGSGTSAQETYGPPLPPGWTLTETGAKPPEAAKAEAAKAKEAETKKALETKEKEAKEAAKKKADLAKVAANKKQFAHLFKGLVDDKGEFLSPSHKETGIKILMEQAAPAEKKDPLAAARTYEYAAALGPQSAEVQSFLRGKVARSHYLAGKKSKDAEVKKTHYEKARKEILESKEISKGNPEANDTYRATTRYLKVFKGNAAELRTSFHKKFEQLNKAGTAKPEEFRSLAADLQVVGEALLKSKGTEPGEKNQDAIRVRNFLGQVKSFQKAEAGKVVKGYELPYTVLAKTKHKSELTEDMKGAAQRNQESLDKLD